MLQEDFPDLNKIYGANSLMPGMFAMDRQEGAQRSQQINQASALQDYYQNEQMNPLRVRSQELANDTSLAQLPGFKADSSLKQDRAKISRDTLGLQLTAQQKKLLADASDDDVKLLENTAQQLAYSSDPQESAQGQKLLALHKAVIQEKSKQKYMSDRQLELEKLRGKDAIDLANVNNAAGRYKKGGALSVSEQLRSGKLSYEKAAVLTNAMADEAEAKGDQEQALLYRNMANNYAQKHVESKQAGALVPRAGTPDLPGLNIPANPAVPVQPMQPASQPAKGVVQSFKDMNMKALVEQTGKPYEPDKYEYRVVDGKVQRRPKQ